MAEGMPVEEVRSMCDLHSQVTRDAFVPLATQPAIEPGHPLDTFRRENAALKRVITAMREIVGQVADLAPNADAKEIVFRLRQSADDLMDLDKHYQRKEHALFSCLERHGITGPSKVMWSKDDEARNLLKQMNRAAHDCGSTVADVKQFFAQHAKTALSTIEEMVLKRKTSSSQCHCRPSPKTSGQRYGPRLRNMVGALSSHRKDTFARRPLGSPLALCPKMEQS